MLSAIASSRLAQNTPANERQRKIMDEMQATAMVVARVIRSTKKFGKVEHEMAMTILMDESENPVNMREGMLRIGNVSAIRQDLEKGGVLPTNVTPSAFSQAVKAALAKLDAVEKAASK